MGEEMAASSSRDGSVDEGEKVNKDSKASSSAEKDGGSIDVSEQDDQKSKSSCSKEPTSSGASSSHQPPPTTETSETLGEPPTKKLKTEQKVFDVDDFIDLESFADCGEGALAQTSNDAELARNLAQSTFYGLEDEILKDAEVAHPEFSRDELRKKLGFRFIFVFCKVCFV